MAKWALKDEPEMVPVPIDSRHFDQLIAEIGELIYGYFCQLENSTDRRDSRTVKPADSKKSARKRTEVLHA